MALGSNDSQELKVKMDSPEKVNKWNLILGVTTFSEGTRSIGEYVTSSNNNSSNTDSSTGNAGGVQNTKTEFVDDGVRTFTEMYIENLNINNIMEIHYQGKDNKGKFNSNESKEHEKE